MRRLAAQQTSEGHDGVDAAAGDELAGHGRNLERARRANDHHVVRLCAMPGQAIERAAQQPVDEFVVEAAGDDGEAQPRGVVVPFERTRHQRRGL